LQEGTDGKQVVVIIKTSSRKWIYWRGKNSRRSNSASNKQNSTNWYRRRSKQLYSKSRRFNICNTWICKNKRSS
jgi:hypothetical protein